MDCEVIKNPELSSGQLLVVIGGTGFVGRHLLNALNEYQQYDVSYAIHRNTPDWLNNKAIEKVQFDLDNIQSIIRILAKDCIVINLLRPDGQSWFTKAIENIVQACQIVKVKRYIHISSIDVYGTSPFNIIETDTPIKPITPYECQHAFAERCVKTINTDTDTIILRLGAVFGVGGSNLVALAKETSHAPFWKLALRRMLYGRRRMHLVSVERVIDTLLFVVTTAHSLKNRVYIITDDNAIENNFASIQDSLITSFGRPSMRYIPYLPTFILKILLKIYGVSNTNPLRRFEENKLHLIGMSHSKDFHLQISSYITHLRENE